MLIFFIAAILVLGFADFAIKQGSGRISPPLGTLIYAASATLLALVWTIWSRGQQPLQFTREGVLWSMATGLAFSIFTGIAFFLFSHGVNLSIGTPILRLGGMVLAAVLSVVVLREPFNLQYIIGFVLAAAGILLIATR